jgi:hypothetical protein
MSMRRHRRRQVFLSAHNFMGRHYGVWRGVVNGQYIRYPYSRGVDDGNL